MIFSLVGSENSRYGKRRLGGGGTLRPKSVSPWPLEKFWCLRLLKYCANASTKVLSYLIKDLGNSVAIGFPGKLTRQFFKGPEVGPPFRRFNIQIISTLFGPSQITAGNGK
jgi:hypothetical protein